MLLTLIKSKLVPQVTLRNDRPLMGERVKLTESGKEGKVIGFAQNSKNVYNIMLDEGAIVEVHYSKLKVLNSKINEKSWPKSYTCNFLEPGVVSYEDVNQGVALLKKDSMDSWIQTFKGKPVIIEHQEIDPSNFKKVAVGYITNVWYNSVDGWYWLEFIITDDEGHEAIKDGYSVSCSFDVVETMSGSEWHSIKYDEEITKGAGLHLALVTSPRYEDCRILVNSKKAHVNAPKCPICGDISYKDTDGNQRCKGCNKLEPDCVCTPKLNATDLTIMSPIQLDKYMGALSDVGLQTIIDGDYNEEIKKIASAYQGDREKKKDEEIMKTKEKENVVLLTNKKEELKMFGLFARKKDKASIENDKIDASKVFVKVDEEMIPLSTLMNSVGSDFELLQETDVVKVNDKEVKIGDLISAYKQNADKKKKDDDEDKEKKKADDKKKKDDEEEDEDKKKKDDSDKKKKDDDDKKKKDDDEEDEEVRNQSKPGDKFFINLENARRTPMDNESKMKTGSDTREDKAARGKKFFGSKKKQ